MKPGTSKSGNSEVYVVCQTFLGIESCREYIEWLCGIYFGMYVHGLTKPFVRSCNIVINSFGC